MNKLFVLLIAFATSLPAQVVRLGTDARGVVLEGAAGKMVLSAPILVGADKKSSKPAVVPSEDGTSAVARYPDGFVINITVSSDDGTITYSFDQPPLNATLMRISVALPSACTDGGSFVLKDSEPVAFPAAFGKQIVAQGTSEQFKLIGGAGDTVTLGLPSLFQQVSDTRAWGAEGFLWTCFHSFEHRPNDTRITFHVSTADR